MDQFISEEQIKDYNESRPAYTKEIFDTIIENINGNDFYIDVACGSGQLTIPLSNYFKVSVGLDISNAQIHQLKENATKLKESEHKIYSFVTDVYNIKQVLKVNQLIKEDDSNGFVDLITIGEAFHWFEEDEILPYLKSLLKPNGILVITGYKRNVFDPSSQKYLHTIYEQVWEKLREYCLYDINTIECAHENSYEHFKKYFSDDSSKVKNPIFFTDIKEIPLGIIFPRIKSISAYINYFKSLNGKEDFILQDLDKQLRNYYSVDKRLSLYEIREKIFINYFLILLKN